MRGHETTFVPDKSLCEQIVNIFHPYDPVAYRLEPLYHSNYKFVRPGRIFSSSESNRDYDNLPFELHKSYLKKVRKEAKKKSKEKTSDAGDNLQKVDEMEDDEDGKPIFYFKLFNFLEDSDSDDEYQSSNGASPRSKSPLTPEEENKADVKSTTRGSTGGSGRWWQFGGGSNTVSDIKKEEKEKEKEEAKPTIEEKKNPLEALLNEIPGF